MEHAFQSGDRNILEVGMAPREEQGGGSNCSCCQVTIPRLRKWYLEYRDPESSHTSDITVCAACARKLAPRRFVVDLVQLDTALADSGGHEIETLREYVGDIRKGRGDLSSTLSLRSADAVELSHKVRLPLSELVRRLDDAGVLVAS